ncbi:MAG TPA: M1 family metallopeptidase [Longimicrobiales bacterium]|nr:M1 family metallopeptidase [Longimicrobiales bacterium]
MRYLPSILLGALLAGCASQSAPPAAAPAPNQTGTASTVLPERAVRRTLPMTNMIRRAHMAGTRDSTGRPGRNYWQLWTEYDINARLDVRTSTITGRETIVLHNNSPESLTEIVLRLDQNIYAPHAVRATQLPEITEGTKVTRITLNGQPVSLTPAPNQGPNTQVTTPTAFGLNSTVANIRLPGANSIQPKTTARLEIDWSFRVPLAEGGRGLRMGRWADSLYQVAQWYPRVAVYDDLRGWDREPYLGPSEFYNNFGRFNVRIDVPAGYLVGATGVLQNPEQVLTPAMRERLARALQTDSVVQVVTENERRLTAGGRTVWHFAADTVNDFAWAASNRYVWDATRANIPGKGFIPVHVLYPPANHGPPANFARVPQSTRHALEFYSKIWMPYAWPVFTVADGPDRGMEYPMFIMSALGAADHEVGHQWWPMMVSNNETWYGFMDEGFNMYMNVLSGADTRNQPPNLNGPGQNYGRVSGTEYEAPQMYNANYGGPMYGFQAYQKAPMMLSMLGGVVGDTAVWRAQSEFTHTWRFKHPTPWDYMYSMNRSLGKNLDWFWYYWLFTTESSNGSIVNATTSSGGKTTVVVRQDGEMPAPVVLKVDLADNTSQTYTFPVDVWFPGSRTFTAVLDTEGRTVTKITLDPDARFPDRDANDNVWPRPTT